MLQHELDKAGRPLVAKELLSQKMETSAKAVA
jgi:hypothetical protein